jgi:hypothetical protein
VVNITRKFTHLYIFHTFSPIYPWVLFTYLHIYCMLIMLALIIKEEMLKVKKRLFIVLTIAFVLSFAISATTCFAGTTTVLTKSTVHQYYRTSLNIGWESCAPVNVYTTLTFTSGYKFMGQTTYYINQYDDYVGGVLYHFRDQVTDYMFDTW